MYITTSSQLSAIGIEASKTYYNCPSCGLSLHYMPDHQSISCKGCGHSEPLSTKVYKPTNYNVARSSFVFMTEDSTLVSCGDCGYQVELSSSEGDYVCPACSMEQEIDHKDGYRTKYWPDAIIPLVIEKEVAVLSFDQWFKSSQLGLDLDKKVLSFSPCYLPYWQVSASGQVTIIRRKTPITIDIQKQLVCSSHFRNMQLIDKSLDFDLSKSVDFDKRYLSGIPYYRYNQSSKESRDRLLQDELYKVIKHADYIYDPKESDYSVDFELTALYLPFYMVEFQIKGLTYLAFVNGQNGQTQGDRPDNIAEHVSYTTRNNLIPAAKNLVTFLLMLLGLLSFLLIGFVALNIAYIFMAYS